MTKVKEKLGRYSWYRKLGKNTMWDLWGIYTTVSSVRKETSANNKHPWLTGTSPVLEVEHLDLFSVKKYMLGKPSCYVTSIQLLRVGTWHSDCLQRLTEGFLCYSRHQHTQTAWTYHKKSLWGRCIHEGTEANVNRILIHCDNVVWSDRFTCSFNLRV
jgi:hypothetical protein